MTLLRIPRNSATKPAEAALESTADKQLTSTKGRKSSRKSKRQFTPTIPEQFFITNYQSNLRNAHDIKKIPYKIPECIIDDVRYSIRAGFASHSAHQSALPDDNIVIGVPYAGATYLQDSLVHAIARELDSDVIKLDQHDISLLTHGLIDPRASTDDIEPVLVEAESNMVNETTRKSSNVEFEDERSDDFIVVDDVLDYVKSVMNQKEGGQNRLSKSFGSYGKSQSEGHARLKAIFGALVTAGERELPANNATTKIERIPKIIYLRDYSHIIESPTGELVVTALLQTIQDIRNNGQPIVVVAGVSPSLSNISSRKGQGQVIEKKSSIESLDMDDVDDLLGNKIKFPYFQLVSIPPSADSPQSMRAWKVQMEQDLALRLEELNARNILMACVQKKIISPAQAFVSTPIVTKILNKMEGARSEHWPMHFINRLVSTATGISMSPSNQHGHPNTFNMSHLIQAEKILKRGSELRSQAITNLKQEYEHSRKQLISVKEGNELDMKELKDVCNDYERKLLTKIVDPARIKTTFEDICAPAATIDTLQTSISLPLLRPDIFSYGILGRNFTSGMLLFGPPGTGKTLLAKAVAKESGSRMIEIQASDIYEMYVGEGEKNVKAVFSLARKLAPCVIFIDEVDSLLNARRSDLASNTHREIVNQFMVEWDGLSSNNHGVILMAATNRPYDLDDAVLRRMPRRILVDLPSEEERAKILTLHLQGEKVDQGVSIEKLAKATPYYSGSDIKNLCIAAALNAVKENTGNDYSNIKAGGNTVPAANAPIRVLKEHHFDQARSQIAPSASEDMHSLIQIHKWDGLYGDGKHRRRHKGIGFNDTEPAKISVKA
ncbi:unnamed protein product [Umbelopsis ramanniana]